MRRAIAAAKHKMGTVDPADRSVVSTMAAVLQVSNMSAVDEWKREDKDYRGRLSTGAAFIPSHSWQSLRR